MLYQKCFSLPLTVVGEGQSGVVSPRVRVAWRGCDGWSGKGMLPCSHSVSLSPLLSHAGSSSSWFHCCTSIFGGSSGEREERGTLVRWPSRYTPGFCYRKLIRSTEGGSRCCCTSVILQIGLQRGTTQGGLGWKEE